MFYYYNDMILLLIIIEMGTNNVLSSLNKLCCNNPGKNTKDK